MAIDESASTHFSAAEIADAIRALSSNELARFRMIARHLAHFTPIVADDLAQDALCLAMDGTRQCPRDIRLLPFLAGIMRSLVSDAAKAGKRHPQRQLEVVMAAGKDWAHGTMTAEEEIIAAEDEAALKDRVATTKRLVLELFDDDFVAQTIAEGMMDGVEGEELRSLTELDKTAFASKRRLIRRRIAKAFPESTKP